MAKKDNRRTYTKEFKISVVNEYRHGKTLSELAKKYTIPTSTLGTWLKVYENEVIEEEEPTVEVDPARVDPTIYKDIEDKDLLLKEKEETIQRLEYEVEKLTQELERVREDARREIGTLKEAIIVLAKTTNI